ncbi:hypothetical protein [Bradyrhizobium sp. SZCCHNRI3043]|uniref:hypothetical protein n=1 Tax=Bradyrhizobium sp. SZCCHNRI3043 TaxID=3057292 RepID=UPI0039657A30
MTDAKTVAIIGAGHSAIGTLIDLAALAEDAPGTQAIWLLRSDEIRRRRSAAAAPLKLPEIGVCTRGGLTSIAALPGCCGGPAPSGVDSCCADDAKAKEAGRSGCGCS